MSRLVVLAVMLFAHFTKSVPAAKRYKIAESLGKHEMEEGTMKSHGQDEKLSVHEKNGAKVSAVQSMMWAWC